MYKKTGKCSSLLGKKENIPKEGQTLALLVKEDKSIPLNMLNDLKK